MEGESLVTLSPKVENFVSKKYFNIADNLNQTGIYTALKETGYYETSKKEASDIVVSLIEGKMNENFHSKLNIIEQLGFLNDAKYDIHRKNVSRMKGIANFGTQTVIDLTFYMMQKYNERKIFSEYMDFYIGTLGFISETPTIVIRKRVEFLYRKANVKFEPEQFREKFFKLASDNVEFIPQIPRTFFDDTEGLFLSILSAVDLQNPDTYNKAGAVGEVLGLKNNRIDHCLEVAKDTSNLNSDLISFTGLSINSIFNDLFSNYSYAKAAAVYTVNNDPYQKVREERKQLIQKGGIVAATVAGAIYMDVPPDVILSSALPVALKFMDSDGSAESVMELVNKFDEFQKSIERT